MSSPQEALFFRPVDVSQVRKAHRLRLEADENERQAIAAHLGLESVQSLKAEIDFRPWRRHGLRVHGELTATVGQICAVTAEPMQTKITETFDERLYPEDREKDPRRIEAVIDVEATDDYETFAGDAVDLGALVVEFLTLAVDLYPKRAGAVLPGGGQEPENRAVDRPATVSPFAGLADHFAAGADKGPARDTGGAESRQGKDGDTE
ncbi:hypothetical protein MNBD_ALPHA09-2224 [hydrothermal vent metagenome]|uniref:DUF177 domain-containing protein n=1 Tax=hydrothermal vent metagenome TaxID=652676 RepID=A0A3B0TH71_9ZZZZ